MKIDDRYELRICLIDYGDGMPGDIYSDFQKFKVERPYSAYRFGFYVFDMKTGAIPACCNDWNDSPEEAMMDYFENCIGEHYYSGLRGRGHE